MFDLKNISVHYKMLPIVFLTFAASHMLFGVGAQNSKSVTISDKRCFEQHQNRITTIIDTLSEFAKDFNNQLTTIEQALHITPPTTRPPVRQHQDLSIEQCYTFGLPSNYTLQAYENANNLHQQRLLISATNNRVLYRLLMIQKKVLDDYGRKQERNLRKNDRNRKIQQG